MPLSRFATATACETDATTGRARSRAPIAMLMRTMSGANSTSSYRDPARVQPSTSAAMIPAAPGTSPWASRSRALAQRLQCQKGWISACMWASALARAAAAPTRSSLWTAMMAAMDWAHTRPDTDPISAAASSPAANSAMAASHVPERKPSTPWPKWKAGMFATAPSRCEWSRPSRSTRAASSSRSSSMSM